MAEADERQTNLLSGAARRITLKEKASLPLHREFSKLLLIVPLAPRSAKIEPEVGFGIVLLDAATAFVKEPNCATALLWSAAFRYHAAA
jgi:hypothetical protein